jgi:hypothetical protein
MAEQTLLDDLYRPGKRIITEKEIEDLQGDEVLWIDVEGANPLDDSAGALRASEVQALDLVLPEDEEDPKWFHADFGTVEVFHGIRVQTITVHREDEDITVVGYTSQMVSPADGEPSDVEVILTDVLDEQGEEVELRREEFDEVYGRIINGEDETGV